jgi:hypothetical protein
METMLVLSYTELLLYLDTGCLCSMTLWNVWKKDDTFLAIQKRQKNNNNLFPTIKWNLIAPFPQNGNAHFTLGIFVKTHGFLYKMVGHILKLVFF